MSPGAGASCGGVHGLVRLSELSNSHGNVVQGVTRAKRVVAQLRRAFPTEVVAGPRVFPDLLFCCNVLAVGKAFNDRLILKVPGGGIHGRCCNCLLRRCRSSECIGLSSLRCGFALVTFRKG